MRLLVVEDNTKVSRFLTRALGENGYMVDVCTHGSDALERTRALDYDLVLLDWMLPDIDGLAVCSELRRQGSTVPILMLTARGELRERVLGLRSGADDYLTKPFETEELLARVEALLRRSGGRSNGLRLGPLRMGQGPHQVQLAGERIELTSREYALLLHLAHRADQIVPRSELLAKVWENSFDSGSNLIEVQISRLRDKLGEHSWMIETVRRIGYRLRSRQPA